VISGQSERQEMQGNEKTLDRPIILLGAPCSGTTFLGKTLGRHAILAFADEPRLVWRYGNDHKCDMLSPQDAREEIKQHIRGYFAAFVSDAGALRLLEKTPSNSLRPAFVAAVLPDCRFIHIMRSPIDAILSIYSNWMTNAYARKGVPPGGLRRRMNEISLRRLRFYAKEIFYRLAPERIARALGQNVWGPRIPGIQGLLRDLDVLDVCALQWRMCVETAVHFGRRLPSNRYMEIWLEDLSPELLRQVLAFCELENDDEVFRAFNQTYEPGLARGRRVQADPAAKARIQRWIEPTLSLIGHDPEA
jgi:Sulfotransferase family